MDAQLSNIECTIAFPERPEVTNILGKTFKPTCIVYRACIYEGQHYESAFVFGAKHDNTEVPMQDNGYPPMPAWFKQIADEMRATTEEAADA